MDFAVELLLKKMAKTEDAIVKMKEKLTVPTKVERKAPHMEPYIFIYTYVFFCKEMDRYKNYKYIYIYVYMHTINIYFFLKIYKKPLGKAY